MKRVFMVAALVALGFTFLSAQPSFAGGKQQGSTLSQHPNSQYYRGKGPQVRGFRRRVGGYSYSYNDSIISYQDNSLYRDPEIERQSSPFDSGFFFDSSVLPLNDSPYLY